jgi:hypothetical protein
MKSTTTPEGTTTMHTDYQLDICHTMERQIGRMNILAISGGRVNRVGYTTLSFPVASGYSVEVEYVEGRDLYTVSRVFTRGAKRWIKGEVTHVYAEDLGEVAYRASCFHDGEFGEVAA